VLLRKEDVSSPAPELVQLFNNATPGEVRKDILNRVKKGTKEARGERLGGV
jgi:hypothetical protein